MTQHYDTDVAIVGFGPTGLTGALTLASKGASVIAFERGTDIYARARAVTVNDWTMRILQDLGIDDRIEHVIEPQRALRWVTYEGHEVLRVEHPPSTLGTRNARPRFFNIYQPTMEAELRRCGEELAGLTVRYGTDVVAGARVIRDVHVERQRARRGRVETKRVLRGLDPARGLRARIGAVRVDRAARLAGEPVDRVDAQSHEVLGGVRHEDLPVIRLARLELQVEVGLRRDLAVLVQRASAKPTDKRCVAGLYDGRRRARKRRRRRGPEGQERAR